MITKKKYKEAVEIVQQYEKEQEENKLLIDRAKVQFPKGMFVVSRLNTLVRGVVKDYSMWSDKVQLKCEDNGELVKILAQNAIVVVSSRIQ